MAEYQHTTLKNGLQLVMVPLEYLHSVEIICYVKVGSWHEAAECSGISHFVEHMLFRGNARYASGPELEQAFEQLGSGVNAATDAESTSYFARVHPQAVDRGLELFATMLQTPKFLNLEIERAIVLEEALSDFNEHGVDVCADNRIARLMWDGSPLSQPVIGIPETIRGFTREDIEDWYQRYYVPDNMVISIAGPVDVEVITAAVKTHFGEWVPSLRAYPGMAQPPLMKPGPHTDWVKDSDSQLTLQLAWRTAGRTHHSSNGLRALRWILGEGGASLLMRTLREDAGLTYSVEANLEEYADCGCFSIDLATDRDNLIAVVQALLEVIAEVRRRLHPQCLERVVRNALNVLDFSRDSAEDLAGRYGFGVLSSNMRTLSDDLHMWRSITPAEVQEAARQCLVSEGMCFVCIGPWHREQLDQVEALLSMED